MVKKKEVRGDKLRDMIFAVYLHNSFSKDRMKVADLKRIVGYSTGGFYSALESSGYFTQENNKINLTQEGKEYVKDEISPRFDIFKSFGNYLFMLGFFFLAQWAFWTYLKVAMIPEWYWTLLIFGCAFFLRFLVLRFSYFMMKRRKKIEYP